MLLTAGFGLPIASNKPKGRTLMLRTAISIFTVAFLVHSFGVTHIVRADETPTEKAQSASDEANAQAKKTKRKAKKATRDATDNKDVVKDAGDSVSNTADSVTKDTKKAVRKAD